MADHHGRMSGRNAARIVRVENVRDHDTRVMVAIHSILRALPTSKAATAAEVARQLRERRVATSRSSAADLQRPRWHRGQVIRILRRLGLQADELASLWLARPIHQRV